MNPADALFIIGLLVLVGTFFAGVKVGRSKEQLANRRKQKDSIAVVKAAEQLVSTDPLTSFSEYQAAKGFLEMQLDRFHAPWELP
jgi:hypothetical protein